MARETAYTDAKGKAIAEALENAARGEGAKVLERLAKQHKVSTATIQQWRRKATGGAPRRASSGGSGGGTVSVATLRRMDEDQLVTLIQKAKQELSGRVGNVDAEVKEEIDRLKQDAAARKEAIKAALAKA